MPLYLYATKLGIRKKYKYSPWNKFVMNLEYKLCKKKIHPFKGNKYINETENVQIGIK
jgi:hypothetical protein